jgi:hypothetical protein
MFLVWILKRWHERLSYLLSSDSRSFQSVSRQFLVTGYLSCRKLHQSILGTTCIYYIGTSDSWQCMKTEYIINHLNSQHSFLGSTLILSSHHYLVIQMAVFLGGLHTRHMHIFPVFLILALCPAYSELICFNM